MKSENLNFLEPSGPLQACNGTALHFTGAQCACGIMGEMMKTSLLCLVPPNEKAGKGNVSTFQPLIVSFSKMK
jgi:hypothetical protein